MPAKQHQRYKIVRHFMVSGEKKTLRRGITLGMAQKHCRSHQSSSKTVTNPVGINLTKKYGAWFDGYDFDSDDPSWATDEQLGLRVLRP